MTRPSSSISPTDQPAQDRLDSVTTRPPPNLTRRIIVGWEQRAKEADERADEAEQRRRDAEHRALEAEAQVLAGEARIGALQRTLDSGAVIDQAKGVLMGVFGLGAEAALDALLSVSHQADLEMATVVERFLVAVHDIDLGDQPREKLTLVLGAMSRSDVEHDS